MASRLKAVRLATVYDPPSKGGGGEYSMRMFIRTNTLTELIKCCLHLKGQVPKDLKKIKTEFIIACPI